MQPGQLGGMVQQSPEIQTPNQMNKTKTALANMLSNRLGNNNNGNYIKYSNYDFKDTKNRHFETKISAILPDIGLPKRR